ncbi:MAG TPA: hypothetical protein VFT82_00920, partial [Candidatus Paceibacterota bacterium]|nr:hypothetical protein [Candidatus Paceibacterota bacterium]
MSNDLFLEGKKYISSRRAAADFGYTQDYVGQLIREKKIDAKMIGRGWFVSEDSIKEYQQSFGSVPKEKSLFTAPKTEASASREINVKEQIVSQTPKTEPKKPELLKYENDERSLLPELKKEVPQPVIPQRMVPSVRLPEIPSFSIPSDFGRKAVAAIMSIAIVSGGYWLAKPGNGSSVLAMMEDAGARARIATLETFDQLAEAARGALDSYVASIEKTGNGISSVRTAFASGGSSSLASVAAANVDGALQSIARSIYGTLHPLVAFLFGENGNSTVSEGSSLAAAAGDSLQGSNTVAVATTTSPKVASATPTLDHGNPSSSVSQVYNNYNVGMDEAAVDARIQLAINALGYRTFVANTNARNSVDYHSSSDIINPKIVNGTVSGAAISDSSIAATSLTVSGNSNFSTGSFGHLVADVASLNTVSISDLNIGNSTSSNLYGGSAILGSLTSYAAPIAPYFTATSSIASSFPYASTTALTVAGTAYATQLGIGTTSPSATIDILQQTNGLPVISAYRATDLAPSGDFITFMTKSGTPLFRVDNSGNLQAGGIINTGSQTITSTSTPQFRVQYNGSNEITTTVSSAGAASIGVSGTSPSLFFSPGANQVASFGFTNASGTTVLGVDTLNGRVGVGTTTPSQALSVQGSGLFSGDLSLANAVATGTVTASNLIGTNAGATSTLAGGLNVAGTGGLSVLQNGQTVIGTTSPLTAGIPLSVAGNLYTFGAGDTRIVSYADANA